MKGLPMLLLKAEFVAAWIGIKAPVINARIKKIISFFIAILLIKYNPEFWQERLVSAILRTYKECLDGNANVI
jgi:hypothetical protein